ncbi:MAG: GNAT family N-acetyltransferase [Micavibrio sp.]|nr:MAG: GNAT family N-acetyltransferase [Micavibrio sp.]
MINCITCRTAQYFGGALSSQFRLRYRSFVDRQSWGLSVFDGMEYDCYDTPAATYLVWQDENREVRGMSRLVPTDRPYMLRDLWPESVEKITLPASLRIWEGSRFCIDKDLPQALRRRITAEIVCAYLEYALAENIETIIGIMPPLIWRSVFIKSGWEVEFLGKAAAYGGGRKNIAGQMLVSEAALHRVREVTGIRHPVLITAPFNTLQFYQERFAE